VVRGWWLVEAPAREIYPMLLLVVRGWQRRQAHQPTIPLTGELVARFMEFGTDVGERRSQVETETPPAEGRGFLDGGGGEA
jgi:hypothetical protein